MSEPKHNVVGSWVLEQKVLGRGSYATVYLGSSTTQPQLLAAIKVVETARLNEKLLESLQYEISAMKRLRHNNVVQLFDIIKTDRRLYLCTEYCDGGDLAQFLRRGGRLQEAQARELLGQLAAGLSALRQLNLVHRDLKPQNLLLSRRRGHQGSQAGLSGFVLKIADFGFARDLPTDSLAETLCGSPLYMAPEILRFQKYDAKADLWSVGAILFELLAGRAPYSGGNPLELLQDIERREAQLPEEVAASLSPECIDLLAQLLRRRPIERMNFAQFFAHPFVGALPSGDQAAGPSEAQPSAQSTAVQGSLATLQIHSLPAAATSQQQPSRAPAASSGPQRARPSFEGLGQAFEPATPPHPSYGHLGGPPTFGALVGPRPPHAPPGASRLGQASPRADSAAAMDCSDSLDRDYVLISASMSSSDEAAPSSRAHMQVTRQAGPAPAPGLPQGPARIPSVRAEAHPLMEAPGYRGPAGQGYQNQHGAGSSAVGPYGGGYPVYGAVVQHGNVRYASAPGPGALFAPNGAAIVPNGSRPSSAFRPSPSSSGYASSTNGGGCPSGSQPSPRRVGQAPAGHGGATASYMFGPGAAADVCCTLDRLRLLDVAHEALLHCSKREARNGRHPEAASLAALALDVAGHARNVLAGPCVVHGDGAHVADLAPLDRRVAAAALEAAEAAARARAVMTAQWPALRGPSYTGPGSAPGSGLMLPSDFLLPDCYDLAYAAGLAFGKSGAVREMSGEPGEAAAAYRRALALLRLLLEEADLMGAGQEEPPLDLAPADRARLAKYVVEIGARARGLGSHNA